VRSICQRSPALGSSVFSRRFLPRQATRVLAATGIGSPLRRGRLIREWMPRLASASSWRRE